MYMQTSNPSSKGTALITGASKGFGKELAISCAKRGYGLILVSLPNSNIDNLANQINENYGVQVDTFEYDLTDEEKVHELAAVINARFSLDILINNAGCGGSGEFEKSPVAYIERVLNLNVRATALLTHLLIPALRRCNGHAYVMNISSMAAFSPMGYKHVYPASKAFLYSFTLGLREEYRDSGISFSSVHPGPMLTNSDTSRRIIQQGIFAKFCLVGTSKVADKALKGTLEGKSVIIPGIGNKISYWIIKVLPSAWVKKMLTTGMKREVALYAVQSS